MSLKRKLSGRPGRPPGPSTEKLIAAVVEAAQAGSRAAEGMEFMHVREVCRKTTLSRTQIYRMMAVGRFPKAKAISVGRKAWLASEVVGWIEERLKGC